MVKYSCIQKTFLIEFSNGSYTAPPLHLWDSLCEEEAYAGNICETDKYSTVLPSFRTGYRCNKHLVYFGIYFASVVCGLRYSTFFIC